jgi:hypothetical protein
MANKTVTNPCSAGGMEPEERIHEGTPAKALCLVCNKLVTVNKKNKRFRKHNG